MRKYIFALAVILLSFALAPHPASAVNTFGDGTFSMPSDYNFASPSVLIHNNYGSIERYVTSSPYTITYQFYTMFDLVSCAFDINGAYAKNGNLQNLGDNNYKCTITLTSSEYKIDYAASIVLRYQFEEGGDWYTNSDAVKQLYAGYHPYTPLIYSANNSGFNFEISYYFDFTSAAPAQKLELFRSYNKGSYAKVADCEADPIQINNLPCKYTEDSNNKNGTFDYYLLATDEIGRTQKSTILTTQKTIISDSGNSTNGNSGSSGTTPTQPSTDNSNTDENNATQEESTDDSVTESNTTNADGSKKDNVKKTDNTKTSLLSDIVKFIKENQTAIIVTTASILSISSVAGVFAYRHFKLAPKTTKVSSVANNKEEA